MKLGGRMEIIALGQKKKKKKASVHSTTHTADAGEFPKEWGRAHLRGLKGETQGR